MSQRLAIPEPLRERQARASNPRTSAWVSANAGSGKTHVLTQRVLRLLLDRNAAGADPVPRLHQGGGGQHGGARFQPARRSGRASATTRWRKRSSTAARRRRSRGISPSPGNCSRARSRRRAGSRSRRCTPSPSDCCGSFRSRPTSRRISKFIDESESKLLLTEARDAALAALSGAPERAGALELVARECGAHAFDDLLKEAVSRAETFRSHADALAYAAALSGLLGLAPDVTRRRTSKPRCLAATIGRMRRETWARDSRRAADPRIEDSPSRLRAANAGGSARRSRRGAAGRVLQGQGRKVRQGRAARRREGQSDNRRAAAKVFRCSKTTCVASRIACAGLRERWRARAGARAQRSPVRRRDSDPCGLRADEGRARRARFRRPDRPRARASHPLERRLGAAQARLRPRSPAASTKRRTPRRRNGAFWRRSAPSSSPAPARGRASRTVFAVGDEKQSIFAFQGAAPEMFAEMKRAFDRRHRDAERPFADVPLTFSFRSSQTILDAVDKTFRIRNGLARRRRRRRTAARGMRRSAVGLEGRRRAMAADRPRPGAGPGRLAPAARSCVGGRSAGRPGQAYRRRHQGLGVGRPHASGWSTPAPATSGAFAKAT